MNAIIGKTLNGHNMTFLPSKGDWMLSENHKPEPCEPADLREAVYIAFQKRLRIIDARLVTIESN